MDRWVVVNMYMPMLFVCDCSRGAGPRTDQSSDSPLGLPSTDRIHVGKWFVDKTLKESSGNQELTVHSHTPAKKHAAVTLADTTTPAQSAPNFAAAPAAATTTANSRTGFSNTLYSAYQSLSPPLPCRFDGVLTATLRRMNPTRFERKR
ncbi:hypothetical protein ACFE04_011751 [Oxalis oulophora]